MIPEYNEQYTRIPPETEVQEIVLQEEPPVMKVPQIVLQIVQQCIQMLMQNFSVVWVLPGFDCDSVSF